MYIALPNDLFAERDLPLLTAVGVLTIFLMLLVIFTLQGLRRVLNRDLLPPFSAKDTTLEQRIAQAGLLSRVLGGINRDIQKELAVQASETERLKTEAFTAQEVAKLNADAVKATQMLFETSIAKKTRFSNVLQIGLTIGGAIFGVASTLIIQSLTGN